MKLKINNKNADPLWKKISCKCDKSNIEASYPLIECVHCNCSKADSSVPSESFKVNRPIYDKNGKFKKDNFIEITEITLTNCSKYGSVIGWKF